MLAGWISSFPSHGFGRVSFELATTLDGVRLRVLVSTREFVVAYGDSVRVHGRPVTKPRSNGAYLRGRGCAGSIRVVPGGVAVLSGELEEASGWSIVVGPRESAGIPAFFKTEYSQRIAQY